METNLDTLQLIDNTAENQFEIRINDQTAFVEYVIKGDKIYLTHTEVPASMQHQGVGSALIGKALKHIKGEKRTLVPSCSFVAAYVDNHPEWHSLLSEGYQM